MRSATTSQLAALEYVVLGLVHQPTHAYAMFQHFRRDLPLGMLWHLKQSHLYALLAQLERAGYVAVSVAPQGTRPPRRMLRLTDLGRTALETWLTAPVEHGRDMRQEFLAKLYFSAQRGADVARALVAVQTEATCRWRDEAQRELDATTQPYRQLVLLYRLGQIDATLTWLEQCAAIIHTTPLIS